MGGSVLLGELQGLYDITYASTPQLINVYEPGFGTAKIEGKKLTGIDALGVIWNATFEISDDNSLSFDALLDPTDAPSTVGLTDSTGTMTREPQSYQGVLKITKSDTHLILRTQVQQGPISIDVQFRKKS